MRQIKIFGPREKINQGLGFPFESDYILNDNMLSIIEMVFGTFSISAKRISSPLLFSSTSKLKLRYQFKLRSLKAK